MASSTTSSILSISVTGVSQTHLYLSVNRKPFSIRWEECSPRLSKATISQRLSLRILPSGDGIHWPEIGEDLVITPLLLQASDSKINQ